MSDIPLDPLDPLYPIRPIELTVVRVEGGGNTGGGRYFYSFRPDVIVIHEPTILCYTMSAATSPGLSLYNMVSSASPGQFEPMPPGDDGRCLQVTNHCVAPELIHLGFVVLDKTPTGKAKPEYIVCDPQVLNIPD